MTQRLTDSWLLSKGACWSQVKLFRRIFRDGDASIHYETLARAVRNGLHVMWLWWFCIEQLYWRSAEGRAAETDPDYSRYTYSARDELYAKHVRFIKDLAHAEGIWSTDVPTICSRLSPKAQRQVASRLWPEIRDAQRAGLLS